MKCYISVVLCLLVLGLYVADDLHCKENRQALQNEAGFITIEPITFYFHYGSYFLVKGEHPLPSPTLKPYLPFFMKSAGES